MIHVVETRGSFERIIASCVLPSDAQSIVDAFRSSTRRSTTIKGWRVVYGEDVDNNPQLTILSRHIAKKLETAEL